MADTPAPEVEKLPVVAYVRATKDGAPVWDEDCVCQDPVYPSDPDGSDAECVSMALVRQSDAEAEIARLRADAERWQKWLPWIRGLNRKPCNLAVEIHRIDAALAAQAKGGEHV